MASNPEKKEQIKSAYNLWNDSKQNDEEMDKDSRKRIKEVKFKMKFLTYMAGIGGFLFGYDTGVVSGAMLPIRDYFGLNSEEEEIIVSCTILSAFLASLIGGPINSSYGRRITIIIASGFFIAGSAILGLAWNFGTLFLGRVVLGCGIGLSSLTSPLYIAEVATPEKRGKLVTLNIVLVVVGQFVAGMIDGLLSNVEEGWRFMLGLAILPSMLMFFGFIILPESPRWLVIKGREIEARYVLRQLRYTDTDVNAEIGMIKVSAAAVQAVENAIIDYEKKIAGRDGSSKFKNFWSLVYRLKNMVSYPTTRRAMRLGCGLMALQQLVGINTVMYYAASIYEMSGFDETTSIWLSGFTSLAQVFGLLISMYLVEKMGRRKLVLGSLSAVAISLFCLGASFYLARINSSPVSNFYDSNCQSQPSLTWSGKTNYCMDCIHIDGCGFCGDLCAPGDDIGPYVNNICPNDSAWRYDNCENTSGWLCVFFMIVYLLSFGVGMSGMPWTINAEIYPLQHRSLAIATSTAFNWLGNFVVSATFLSISSPNVLTIHGAFWLYGFIASAGLIWVYYALPETKGKNLEEIEVLFRKESDTPMSGVDQIINCKEKEALSAYAKFDAHGGGH